MHENTSLQSTDQAAAVRSGVLARNHRAGRTWSAGGRAYDRISAQIADAIAHCVDRLDPRPGERVLDVGTGTGWAARRAFERGPQVTGVDIGEDVIAAARELSPQAIDFRVGDAEALDLPDASFDAVMSTFGVMFCGDPEQAAAELARVCKPGGRLALATWLSGGGVNEMFNVIKAHMPEPPSGPSPFAWGDTNRLVALLGDDFDLGFESGTSYYREPDATSAWESFSTGFGPVVTLLGKLDRDQTRAFRSDFEGFHERHRTGAGILVPRQYVITVGRRRG